MSEEWREVPGYPHYQVSNLGRVRSIEHVSEYLSRWGTSHPRRHPGKMKALTPHRGYRVVILGKRQTFGVHQVVAWAFIGPQEDGMTVNHINGVKTDNRPENLEYCTNSENMAHAHRTGLRKYGPRKFTERQVQRIRRLHPLLGSKEIALQHGISESHALRIAKGEAYSAAKT